MTTANAWPQLDVAGWAPTKKSLHLYAQMLGKLRLALAPHQPNFAFASLAHTPRGCTTGPMPVGTRTLAASIDVFRAEIILESSDGQTRHIDLSAPQTVARVFGELHAALDTLAVPVRLSPIPQEVADLTPFDTDDRPAVFEPADAQRWLTLMSVTNGVFDRWRSHFFGRTGIALWWGAFDFALSLFNGEHVEAPRDRGYLIRYDLDAEMLNVGFYPGDEQHPPNFYGYIYPEPPDCDTLPIGLQGATWSNALREWVLPYEAVRAAADPAAVLTAFLDAVYTICSSRAGWNSARYTYVPPPLRRAPDDRPTHV